MASLASVSPGDVIINSINLSNIKGNSLNIINQVVTVNLFESIMAPTLYAEFLIWDSLDLLNQFPIKGEETITFDWETPGIENRSHTFAVIKPSSIKSGINDRDKQYVLRCISIDHLKNSKNRFSKKYNDTAKNIIQSILQNQLGTDKQFDGEETKGTHDIIVPKLYPFQAIDWLRRRAVSSQYQGHSFAFFENKNGYNFKTLESLIKGSGGNIGRDFFYDASVLESFANITIRNILAYKNLSQGDSISSIASGGFRNMVRHFDIFTKQLNEIDYKNIDKQGSFVFPDGNNPWNSSQFENQYNDKHSQFMFLPKDTSRPENYIPDMMGPRHGYVQRIIQNMAQIKVYGDSSLTAGELVTAKLPNMSGLSGAPTAGQFIGGNFLITKLRHMISMVERRLYHQSIEMVKGDLPDN